MALPVTYQSRSTRLVAGLAVTAATILCVSVLVILWVLGTSSSAMDRAQNDGQTHLVRALLKSRQNQVVTALSDYTTWIDLFNHLKGPADPAWEVENLGPYLLQTFDIDDIFIVTRSGRVVYSYRADRKDVTGNTLPGSKLLQQLAVSAFAQENRPGAISGVILLDGTPAMAAASVIRPTGVKTAPEFAMVEADVLPPNVAAAMGKAYGLSDLKIERSQGRGLALMDPQNRPSGFTVSWAESASGRQLFHQVLPAILVISIIAALAFAGVAFTSWRFLSDLKEGEGRVLAAELEATRAQARAAEETSRSKSAFIANMSHELRTPLNAILGFSEVLRAGTFGPLPKGKYGEYIGDIHASGEHLLRLVNALLQLSKIEADKMDTRIETVSAHDAIDSSISMVGILAAKRDIRIQIHRHSASPQILADKDLLQQILINLLSNAVKFSEDGGLVEIGCTHDAEHCVIRISDRGCGIPAETLAQLGKPFVQAEGAFSRKYQGTGLGLAISFRLAQLMGASLAIDSIEGDGTTATLTLRIADREAEFRAA
jgi:signal transduction histidine kinase